MGNRKALAAVIVGGAVLAIAAVLAVYFIFLTGPREVVPASELEPFSLPQLVDTPPDEVWTDDSGEDASGFTTRAGLGSDAESIGALAIEKIGLECLVYDSDEATVMEDMKRGAAHYKSTSYWSGNVGLSAHNGNAAYSFFDKLPQLREGDVITYETALGTRRYAVVTIATIADDDWSFLGRTDDNRITLTTCVTGSDNARLCVQAVETAD
jgi:sortase A